MLQVDLLDAPDEHLRLLFEGFRLQVRYDRRDNHANVQVTIVDDPSTVSAPTSCRSSRRPPRSGGRLAPTATVPMLLAPPGGAGPVLRRVIRFTRRVPLA
ncbi:MAG: hypothetical protein ACYCO3_11205 [Mycobacteriales bacterium]